MCLNCNCNFAVLPVSPTFPSITHMYTHIPQQIEIFPGGLGGRTEIDLILNQDGERETRGDSPPSLPPVAASSYKKKGEKEKKGKKFKD